MVTSRLWGDLAMEPSQIPNAWGLKSFVQKGAVSAYNLHTYSYIFEIISRLLIIPTL